MKLFTTSRHGDALVVAADAAVGSLNASDFHDEADRLIAQMRESSLKKLVFDLKRAEYFGSQMLELMISVWRHVSPANGALALCHVSEAGRDVLHVVGLDMFWPVCNTLDEAISALGPSSESST